jgi:division protein CdvB (Snf7/Vps24/ESCRT-III family)
MEDFRKVYNYTTVHDERFESASVYQTIQDAYGKAATDYIDQLYRELNAGATVDPRETTFKTFISKFKKASVMMSASVVVQQFSSIGRAYAVIDPRHFAGAKVNSDTKLSAAEEMKKYAPVAIIKEMGGFDTGTKGSAKSYIMAEKYGKGERLQGLKKDEQYRSDLMGYLPAKADEKTWCAIWEAAKRETKAKHPKMDVKSEEFLKLAGERFSEVIEKTQVYDSVLARSANMRSKGAFMAMATAFMAEPTTTINLIEDAIRSGDKKHMARAFGSVAVSIVLNNALASIVYAMRDDDEDETLIEKYFQSFTAGMIDDINPMSYYPFLKDVYSLFQGYDVERADMSVIADVRDALKKAISVIGKDTSEMDDEQLAEHYKTVTGALMSLVDAGCSMFGVPFKNVRRDAKGIINAFTTAGKDLTERDATWNSFWDKVGAAAKDTIPVLAWTKDKAKGDKLYDAIVSGDKAYLARLKSAYKTEDAYQSAVRKVLRENDPRIKEAAQARYEGNIAECKRIYQEIKKEGKFDPNDILEAIYSEEAAIRNELKPETETSDYSATDFVNAVIYGEADMAQAMMGEIIATKVANGKTEEEAEAAFCDSVSTATRNAFDAGLLDEAGAENMLLEYAGKDEEEAASKVSYWAFCKEHSEHKDVFTEANVAKFYEFAEPAGIPVDVYVQFINGTKGLETIKDEWGDEIKSKRDQVLEVIDSLPLTWQQKDALYLAAGYAESKIWDVPW